MLRALPPESLWRGAKGSKPASKQPVAAKQHGGSGRAATAKRLSAASATSALNALLVGLVCILVAALCIMRRHARLTAARHSAARAQRELRTPLAGAHMSPLVMASLADSRSSRVGSATASAASSPTPSVRHSLDETPPAAAEQGLLGGHSLYGLLRSPFAREADDEPRTPPRQLLSPQASLHAQGGASLVSRAQAEQQAVAALRALPTSTWMGAPRGAEEAARCALCLETLATGDVIRWLPCAHHFHQACVDHWLLRTQRHRTRSCPLCNADPLAAIAALEQEIEPMEAALD